MKNIKGQLESDNHATQRGSQSCGGPDLLAFTSDDPDSYIGTVNTPVGIFQSDNFTEFISGNLTELVGEAQELNKEIFSTHSDITYETDGVLYNRSDRDGITTEFTYNRLSGDAIMYMTDYHIALSDGYMGCGNPVRPDFLAVSTSTYSWINWSLLSSAYLLRSLN